jgi:5-methylcytosine-specific restriction protein A
VRQEFSKKIKLAVAYRAGGKCEECGAKLFVGKAHYDHIVADALGGKATEDNCKLLCTACHGAKSASHDIPMIRKADRQKAKHIGAVKRRKSKYIRHLDGRVTLREPE